MSSASSDRIGESVLLIEKLLPTLPEETVRELRDMLGARLALPTAAQRRRERLGTLLDFLRSYGRPPTVSEYEQHHRQMLEDGEQSMPVSTLIEHYDSYAEAVGVAVRFYTRGTAARAEAHGFRHAQKTYWTESGCLDAVEACRDQIGHWPSKSEFAELRNAGTKLTRACGWDGLKLPAEKQISRLFGNYGEMLAAAKRRAAQAAEQARHAISGDDPTASTPPSTQDSAPAGYSSRRGRSVQRRPRSARINFQ